MRNRNLVPPNRSARCLAGRTNVPQRLAMDLIQQLNRQLDFIITSCRHYDAGKHDEAIRIALAARVLFHDTKKSRSLVGSLLNRPDVRMRSTVTIPGQMDANILGLLSLDLSNGNFRPIFDDKRRSAEVPLRVWWREEIIGGYPLDASDKKSIPFTRRDVVLEAAHTDGGAHVDTSYSARYQSMIEGLGFQIGVRFRNGADALISFRNANLAALRQIGHEIITSPELDTLAHSRLTQ